MYLFVDLVSFNMSQNLMHALSFNFFEAELISIRQNMVRMLIHICKQHQTLNELVRHGSNALLGHLLKHHLKLLKRNFFLAKFVAF